MAILKGFVHGSSVYTCFECGKKTRATTPEDKACGLCAKCYKKSEIINSYNDGDLTQEEYDAAIVAVDNGEI